MFVLCAVWNMDRLIGRSLDVEEPMTPKEKAVKNEFLGAANTRRVYKSAQNHVNARLSYATVVDVMHRQFTLALGGASRVVVDDLNQATINSLYESNEKHLKAMAHAREVDFTNSRIPTNMLPRPSFNLQEEDEVSGRHQVILR